MEDDKEVIHQPEPVVERRNDIFIGKNGLRAGWRLATYWAIVAGSATVIATLIGMFFHVRAGVPGVWGQLAQEVIGFAVAFGAAMVMSRIEKRPVGVYGLPGNEFFGSKFWLGFLFGLVEISVLIGLIGALGGYSFGTFALQGRAIFLWGAFHLVMFTMVGFFEEFLFRGYTQYTLGEGIGFWPAAFVVSFLFGAVHLGSGNVGENVVGAAGIVVVGLLFCFTLWRTGSLWYAVGMHASFDWGETYLYSVPNSGTYMQGHLSNPVIHGPSWLTGGTVGPEASVFCFLTMGLQFLVVMWLFPRKKKDEERVEEKI